MPKARMCEIILYVDEVKEIINTMKDKSNIDKYVCIKHDKDVWTAEDELKNTSHKAGEAKAVHWHLYMHFNESRTFVDVAKWFGLEDNLVEKIKGRWVNAVMYATHLNAPEKYQYPAECVLSNYDWQAEVAKYVRNKSDKTRLDEILSGIDAGVINLYNLDSCVNMQEYVKWKKQIDKAFDYRQIRRKNANEHKLQVVYTYGASGTGKTSFAIEYCKEKGISYHRTGSSNDVFQDYAGQECIILDELRPETFQLMDLLLMLDNNNGGCVASRYRNKLLECSLVFITTPLEIEEFFKKLKCSERESIVQFKRRCKTLMKFEHDKITIVCYDDANEDYDWSKMRIMENPVATLHAKENLTAEEVDKRVDEFLILGAKDITEEAQAKRNAEIEAMTHEELEEAKREIREESKKRNLGKYLEMFGE